MKKQFKSKTITQLKKAQGMLKKVISMVEEDQYCMDLLQQNLATIGLLKGANKMILENHLNACFKTGMKSANSKRQQVLIKELLHVINKA